jgi:hypothetical protein
MKKLSEYLEKIITESEKNYKDAYNTITESN